MKNVKIESVGHCAVRLTASKGFILKSKVTKKEYDTIVTNDIKRWEFMKMTEAEAEETAEEQPVAEAEETAEEQPVAEAEETAEEQPVDEAEETAEEQPVDEAEETAEEQPNRKK